MEKTFSARLTSPMSAKLGGPTRGMPTGPWSLDARIMGRR